MSKNDVGFASDNLKICAGSMGRSRLLTFGDTHKKLWVWSKGQGGLLKRGGKDLYKTHS